MFQPRDVYLSVLEYINVFIKQNEYKAKRLRELVKESEKALIVVQPSLNSIGEFLQYYLNTQGKPAFVTYSEKEFSKMDDLFVLKVYSLDISPIEDRLGSREQLNFTAHKNGEELLRVVFPIGHPKIKSFALPFLAFMALVDDVEIQAIVENLKKIIDHSIEQQKTLKSVYEILSSYGRCFCLGKGFGYPIAMIICEVLRSCLGIHAESYPAGESKHGPIALIEKNFPVIQVLLEEKNKSKVITSIMEMKTRGAQIISIFHSFDDELKEKTDYLIVLPIEGEKQKITLASLMYLIPFIC
ncbi:MAG: SIS domain-containing protein [Candidatus Njordarchaeia archaeon]